MTDSIGKKHRHRQNLYNKQGGKCHFCKEKMLLSFQHLAPHPLNLAVFHKLNRSGNTLRVLCCYSCGQAHNGQMVGEKPNKGKISKRRQNLFERFGGVCHWCRQPTRLLPSSRGASNLPSDAATIDHLHSKRSGLRNKYRGGLVLACYECNHSRGKVQGVKLHILNRAFEPVRHHLEFFVGIK